MRHAHESGDPASAAAGAPAARSGTQPPISPAARRWASLWSELDFAGSTLLGQAPHVKAERFGPHVELIPQLFDLHQGRRFICIGIKYDAGPGKRRPTGSVAFGQFLNLAFADWGIADQLWELLLTGDMGVSFNDLEVIDGNFDRATKARDQYEKDKWVQRVWELKVRLEKVAKEHTLEALERIEAALRSAKASGAQLVRAGVLLPSSLLHPDPAKEAPTRFRINQGLYGDHTYFIDRPQDGMMRVYGIPPRKMFERASELNRDLSDRWLGLIGRTLDELIELTQDREGAVLARAIESAEVVKKLNAIVGTFWTMWRQPIFSANADFEVVTDHERRAAKYMDIMIQRTMRILLKQTVEGIGVYPYTTVNRDNYWKKVNGLKEALRRASYILQTYARVDSVPAFNAANREKDRLVWEFHHRVLREPEGATREAAPN